MTLDAGCLLLFTPDKLQEKIDELPQWDVMLSLTLRPKALIETFLRTHVRSEKAAIQNKKTFIF